MGTRGEKRSILYALPALLLAGAVHAQTAAPSKPARLALVIGNGAYAEAPLPNPTNDAADMARALESSGFTVIKRENATLREMHLALREFGDRLGRQTTGLFYFAGHGLQVRGRNYLVPVDADIQREDEVAFAALDLNAVMEKLDSAKNPVNIVVLDACRNNPFGGRFAASSRGLAPIDAPPGTLVAFATAPGSTAADGSGRNGLYTQHLVQAIEKPGVAVEEVFKSVRSGVRSASKGQQTPWESTSLETAFVFRSLPPRPAPVPVKAAASASTAPALPVAAPPNFARGDSWSYRLRNRLDDSERTVGYQVTDIRGEEVHYSNGNVSDLVGNLMRVTRANGMVESWKPSTQYFVFPLKSGATWTLKSEQTVGERKYDLQVRVKVGTEEDVEVPAGRMRALRIDREVRWKQRGGDRAGVTTATYWYNSAVKRFIAGETKNVTAEGKTLLDERYELASWRVK